MVSWSFAFRRGSIIFLWVLLWVVIGIVIIMAFSIPMIVSLLSYGASNILNLQNPTGIALPSVPLADIGLTVLGDVIGILVISIGIYSTIFKITLDEAEKRIAVMTERMNGPPAPPPYQQHSP